jgi:hypothetical protein
MASYSDLTPVHKHYSSQGLAEAAEVVVQDMRLLMLIPNLQIDNFQPLITASQLLHLDLRLSGGSLPD